MVQAQLSPVPDGGYANQNTAEGEDALFHLAPNGVRNTAIGFEALFSNTGGGANTAVGAAALAQNTANDNTACGSYALTSNTTGSGNTAFGIDALMLNINGSSNHASGHDALFHNTRGNNNTANGLNALFNNTTGSSNTADGFQALSGNTSGSGNIALGNRAGANLTIGNNNIDVGSVGVAAESSTIRIGGSSQVRTFIAGINGVAVSGANVRVNAAGQLGVVPSSVRFKDEIKPMDKSSEAILSLKPVSFRYKTEIDPDRVPQFGLVAEDVDKVNPHLVVRDKEGKPYAVRYEAVNAMLLNEFLKEHRKVEDLEKQVEKLTAGLQKVSAEVEMSKPAPQLVENHQ